MDQTCDLVICTEGDEEGETLRTMALSLNRDVAMREFYLIYSYADCS